MKPLNITGTADKHSAPRRSEDDAVPQVLKSSAIGAGSHTARSSQTGEAGAPNLSTPAKPWGNHPLCPTCNRGAMGCICNVPEPEQEFFKPGINRDPDWHRVEF